VLRFITACLLLACTANVSAEKITPSLVEQSRTCLQPWLDGLNLIIKSDPKNQDLKAYREVLSNAAFGESITLQGKSSVRIISRVPNPDKAWLVAVPVCSEQVPFPENLKKEKFLAAYNESTKIIFLNSSFSTPTLLKGVVLIHEMRHVVQHLSPVAPEGTPGLSLFLEVDAYEHEFQLLDRLRLPGYESLIASEVKRVKEDLASKGKAEPNVTDRRLALIFPGLGTDLVSRQLAATEIFLRTLFKLYDIESSEEVALKKKMDTMVSIGYR
jgi:hypothetical protein